LMITKSAFKEVEYEAIEQFPFETGGIFIGKQVCGYIVVPFVIGSGKRPKRGPSYYSPDIHAQQKALDYISSETRLNYIGEYHSHPMPFPNLSNIDKQTIRNILTNPDYGIEAGLSAIINPRFRSAVLHPFYVLRDDGEFLEIPYSVISDDDPLVGYVLPIIKNLNFQSGQQPSQMDQNVE